MTVGVLALQGCVDHHIRHLTQCGVISRRVRASEDLENLDRIILPGGESSTMLLLLQKSGLWESLKQFVNTKPSWGVCAGSILLAQEVENPKQESLKALPIKAYRNFYGSQNESFSVALEIEAIGKRLEVDFIRAPQLQVLDKDCDILAEHKDSAVLIKHKRTLVSAFHSELSDDPSLHRYFLSL